MFILHDFFPLFSKKETGVDMKTLNQQPKTIQKLTAFCVLT